MVLHGDMLQGHGGHRDAALPELLLHLEELDPPLPLSILRPPLLRVRGSHTVRDQAGHGGRREGQVHRQGRPATGTAGK